MTENFLLKLIKGEIKLEPYPKIETTLKLKIPLPKDDCWIKQNGKRKNEYKSSD